MSFRFITKGASGAMAAETQRRELEWKVLATLGSQPKPLGRGLTWLFQRHSRPWVRSGSRLAKVVSMARGFSPLRRFARAARGTHGKKQNIENSTVYGGLPLHISIHILVPMWICTSTHVPKDVCIHMRVHIFSAAAPHKSSKVVPVQELEPHNPQDALLAHERLGVSLAFLNAFVEYHQIKVCLVYPACVCSTTFPSLSAGRLGSGQYGSGLIARPAHMMVTQAGHPYF